MGLVMQTDYKLDELAREADVAPRTVRYYVQRGLLPAPAFRGKDTTYNHEHLLRLRAIKRLQQEAMPLDAIQARLALLSLAEIERLAQGLPEKTPQGRGGPYRSPPPTRSFVSERWERILLLPGLELHLRESAGAEARRLADEIQAQYGSSSSTLDHEE